MAEAEVADMDTSRVDEHFRGLNLPQGIVENDVGRSQPDMGLQWWLGATSRPCPLEGGGGREAATEGGDTAVSPIEGGLYLVVVGHGFGGEADGPLLLALVETGLQPEALVGILTEQHGRLEESLLVLETGEIALDADALETVVDISLERRVGIDAQRKAEHRLEERIVEQVDVETEVVAGLHLLGRGRDDSWQVGVQNAHQAGG